MHRKGDTYIMKKFVWLASVLLVLSFGLMACSSDGSSATEGNESNTEDKNKNEEEKKKESKYEFTKPDTVRGLYVTGHSAGGEKFDSLLDLIDDSELNSMVVDIKDDNGNITYEPDKELPFSDQGEAYMK